MNRRNLMRALVAVPIAAIAAPLLPKPKPLNWSVAYIAKPDGLLELTSVSPVLTDLSMGVPSETWRAGQVLTAADLNTAFYAQRSSTMKRYKYAACVGAPWGKAVVEALKPIRIAVIANPEPRHRSYDFRYTFFLNWSYIVDKSTTGAYKCVNFHCTDLRVNPMRGGNPIENLILRGHTETVITAHQMTQEIDAGPIYGVSESVSLAGTKNEILERFVEPVTGLIRMIIEEEPEPVPQQGEVVAFKRLEQSEYEKFWATRALMTDESLWRVIGE